jgi:hypothetical protein
MEKSSLASMALPEPPPAVGSILKIPPSVIQSEGSLKLNAFSLGSWVRLKIIDCAWPNVPMKTKSKQLIKKGFDFFMVLYLKSSEIKYHTSTD